VGMDAPKPPMQGSANWGLVEFGAFEVKDGPAKRPQTSYDTLHERNGKWYWCSLNNAIFCVKCPSCTDDDSDEWDVWGLRQICVFKGCEFTLTMCGANMRYRTMGRVDVHH